LSANDIYKKLRLPLLFFVLITSILLFRAVVWPFLAALALAVLLEPLIYWIQCKGASRMAAVVTVFLMVLVVLIIFVLWVMPSIIQDLNQALAKSPRYAKDLMNLFSHYHKLFQRLPENLRVFLNSTAIRGEEFLRNLVVKVAATILAIFSRALPLLLVPILAFYMSLDLRKWLTGIKKQMGQWLGKDCAVLEKTLRVVIGYVRGQLLDSMVVGALLSLGLLALGVDLALLIGALAGIFNLIPYFGPVIGAIPAILLAGMESPWRALYVVILFFAVNQIEAMVLAPKLVGKQVGLHPVAVIFLLLFGGEYLGFFGMILAVPIGAVLQVLLHHYLQKAG
jgi:predicted PurR-regulated permease PerM